MIWSSLKSLASDSFELRAAISPSGIVDEDCYTSHWWRALSRRNVCGSRRKRKVSAKGSRRKVWRKVWQVCGEKETENPKMMVASQDLSIPPPSRGLTCWYTHIYGYEYLLWTLAQYIKWCACTESWHGVYHIGINGMIDIKVWINIMNTIMRCKTNSPVILWCVQ